MIVDDEPHVRVFMKKILQQLGVTTFSEAGDAKEALELFAREHPKLVVLDINMPGMSGFEVLKRIRAIDEGTLVVIMTSQATLNAVTESLKGGADGFIRKDLPNKHIVRQFDEVFADVGDPGK
jgi:DNA-binding NarL/FixJ family response regulator